MKIGITGASSQIGQHLVRHLSAKYEVVTLGRRNSVIPWTLGVTPNPLELRRLDAIVHLAWSLRDREGDFHLNVGGTSLLAESAKEVGVPFLFVSSVAALSSSKYGKSKLAAENLVTIHQGDVLRIGLIRNLNRYEDPAATLIKVFPNLPIPVNTTNYDDFEHFIDRWLATVRRSESSGHLHTLVTSSVSPQLLFAGKSRFALPISYHLARKVLAVFTLVSLRARNLEDALISWVTTPKVGE